MGNLINLIYNELFKIYIRKSTWAMYIILAGLIIGGAVLTNSFDNTNERYAGDNWREVLEEENAAIEEEMGAVAGDGSYVNWEYEKNDFYLENDIQPSYTTWDYSFENTGLLSIVSLFTIIIGAGIVANEFRWGTIKQLLIRPISRSKILASKYIAVLIFALVTSVFLILFSWIIGALFFGVNGFDSSIVLEQNGEYLHVSAINEILSSLGYGFVNLIMMTTFAFMISTVFRNSSLAIGTAIFLMMAGNTIVAIFMEKEWAKYILFANTDLSQYANGKEPFIEGMSLGFSITMLIIYYAIFQFLSWFVFAKRDVAGQ
ncbi:ABC transporter permease [Oceanobacillus bengalensis]|uniref:ABC transporter permease n=1 Tax=Oceanobacillus bengalensis TaxID=1435466 RepID=A0A494YSG0_9BACI|nr:ABC transporter permease subunit [Oceanobacillus bengalensis]RKQ12821.1 ABC transporter permease [Oceanobacillus bengalensis]